ncbi:MAG: hypothetical protein ACT4QF_23020 [Sporichthyaceae bacterium]
MSATRRDEMLSAVGTDPRFDRLRAVVQRLLEARVGVALLLEDLDAIRALVPSEVEDDVLDVMDLLTGWCAPSARLEPPGDA